LTSSPPIANTSAQTSQEYRALRSSSLAVRPGGFVRAIPGLSMTQRHESDGWLAAE
jgi:hypothetical protein